MNIHWKDWCWSSNTLATQCKEPTHWKRPWCWERLKAREEWGDRVWDNWVVSPTQWTWVWANSGRWWKTGKPGVVQWMGHKELDTTKQLNNKVLRWLKQKNKEYGKEVKSKANRGCVGSGLVGVHFKGTLWAELYAVISKNWLTPRGATSPQLESVFS